MLKAGSVITEPMPSYRIFSFSSSDGPLILLRGSKSRLFPFNFLIS